ncbi:MAG TPA: SUMF1/EgtB/PvdO family nonheme iron enzyme [Candidatus Competibacter sp.]|nr:SUMF1/EgtB/PvdO family nonheme iron enzyme [Candidatus Competibacter sp.]
MDPIKPWGLSLLLLTLIGWSSAAWAAERTALVIGNAVYAQERPLVNTLRDARAMAEMLRGLGFEVTLLEDLAAIPMRQAIERYLERVKQQKGTVLFYYSGHGLQDHNRVNYLIPVDARIAQPGDIKAYGYNVNDLLEKLADRPHHTVSLVILDACRDNPFATGKGGRGLERVMAGRGTLVLYAASPGQVADDRPNEKNGLFTRYLLDVLPQPGLDVEDAFDRVAEAVERMSRGIQIPYKEGDLRGKYYLAGLPNDERSLWQSAEQCGTVTCIELYLQEYPSGRYAEMARAYLQKWPVSAPEDTHEGNASNTRNHPGFWGALIALPLTGVAVWQFRRRRASRVVTAPTATPATAATAECDVRVSAAEPPMPSQASVTPPVREPFSVFQDRLRDGSVGPAMIVVPAGTFWMGSPEDEVGRGEDECRHRVRIDQAFALGQMAVTVGEFKCFVQTVGYTTEAEKGIGGQGSYAWNGSQWSLDANRNWRSPGFAQDDTHPVVCVSWNDAVAYLAWLSMQTGQTYRLPTEAEWEYAARAGTGTAFWWGNDITPDQANYYSADSYLHGGATGNWRAQTVSVRQFQPNPWGFYQVHGNVWEWTGSAYAKDYDGSEAKCTNKDTDVTLALRGGCWDSQPAGVRSAGRGGNDPANRFDDLGFRLARSL